MRDSEDFSITVRRGARAGGATVVVHVLPDALSDEAPRVGFVVSKAVGTAVVRNQVKRRLRHALREHHLAGLPAGSRVVVRALEPSAGASAAALVNDVDAALRRCGAL